MNPMNQVKKLFTIKHKWIFLTAFFLAALIILAKPAGLSAGQSVVLGCALFGITGWASGFLPRVTISLFLLLVFCLWGDTAMERVFTFPLSANFITIAASFLLSRAVVKSRAADKAAEVVLNRWCRSSRGLVVMLCFLNILLMLLIPQPIPRIVLLSSVCAVFTDGKGLEGDEKRAVLFSVFVSATATSMIVKNGDVVLNNTALDVSGAAIGQGEWLLYMTPPSLLASLLLLLLFLAVFRKDLKTNFDIGEAGDGGVARAEGLARVQSVAGAEGLAGGEKAASEVKTAGGGEMADLGERGKRQAGLVLDGATKRSAWIMAVVILLWMSESWHGVSAALVALAGVAVMFLAQVLRLADIKTINGELLLFLTAAFSIGNVLVDSGTAAALTEHLLGDYRPQGAFELMAAAILLVMVIHMAVGSAVTALSVSVPVAAAVVGGGISPEALGLLSLVLVTVHYVLPFHQLTIMVGYGKEYFLNRDVLRFCLPLTAYTVLVILLVYLPWWRLTGLI